MEVHSLLSYSIHSKKMKRITSIFSALLWQTNADIFWETNALKKLQSQYASPTGENSTHTRGVTHNHNVFKTSNLPRSSDSCTDPFSFTELPNSFTADEYVSFRAQCTNKCNAEGHCCTLGFGGCDTVPCNEGCHIAFFTDNVEACKAECTRANDAPDCEYKDDSHRKVAFLNYYPWWPEVEAGKL